MLFKKSSLTLAVASLSLTPVFLPVLSLADETATAEPVELETYTVTAVRENRISTGATGLPLEIKDTPQAISVISSEDMLQHGATGSNDALDLMNGIDVQGWETNRSTLNARGFEVQLTQVDGIGTSNDYATIIGEYDTYIFEKIELIRGANSLLTGVGNSSGTVNYVRKRPANEDEGELILSAGSYDLRRAALDYNKVLTSDGTWAGRVVAAREDSGSHIRDLENKRTTFYGVIDGQIGDSGVLTAGVNYQKNDQSSPMWGSLTLNYVDGDPAEFDVDSSTSADWTYWNTENRSAFVEYLHHLGGSWQAKLSYTLSDYNGQSRLLYAYTNEGGLQDDNTGLIGWPYAGYTEKRSSVIDASINGEFELGGRYHTAVAGVSYIDEENDTWSRDVLSGGFLPYPAFDEYDGNDYAEPEFGEKTKRGEGEKKLTRLYAASRLEVADTVHAVVGLNAIKLEREGSSIYGAVSTSTHYPDLEEVSPYAGLTWDVTEDVVTYVSYSDIFQNQDEGDFNGDYLDPMKGVNYEAGVKAELLDDRLLATFAVFKAIQEGVATYGGINDNGQSYYVPTDVNSVGYEAEIGGEVTDNSNLVVGFVRLKVTDADGNNASPWIPRSVLKIRYDARVPAVPALKLGFNFKRESDAYNNAGYQQEAFSLVNAFAAYDINDQATLRLNVNNVFDEKYVEGLPYGGIYGAPANASMTFSYNF